MLSGGPNWLIVRGPRICGLKRVLTSPFARPPPQAAGGHVACNDSASLQGTCLQEAGGPPRPKLLQSRCREHALAESMRTCVLPIHDLHLHLLLCFFLLIPSSLRPPPWCEHAPTREHAHTNVLSGLEHGRAHIAKTKESERVAPLRGVGVLVSCKRVAGAGSQSPQPLNPLTP